MFSCRKCGKKIDMKFCGSCGSELDYENGEGIPVRMLIIKSLEGKGELPNAACRRIINIGGAKRAAPDASEVMSLVLTRIGARISKEAAENIDRRKKIKEHHRITMRSEDIIGACRNLGLY